MIRLVVLVFAIAAVCATSAQHLPAAPAHGCAAAQIPANLVLYHGTSVQQFATNFFSAPEVAAGAYNTQSQHYPGGPGWFATTVGFALHAGMRQVPATGNGYLNRYTAAAAINVLHCATWADFYAAHGHLDTNHILNGGTDEDVTGARAFCHQMATHNYAGYIIQADRIRVQPEVILCQPDQFLNFGAQEVIAVTVHDGANAANTHPDGAGGVTMTWTQGGVPMRLWWPPASADMKDDLIRTDTNAQVLLETRVAVLTRLFARRGPAKAPKPLQKPSKVNRGAAMQALSGPAAEKNKKAVAKEKDGASSHWSKADIARANKRKKVPKGAGKKGGAKPPAKKPTSKKGKF